MTLTQDGNKSYPSSRTYVELLQKGTTALFSQSLTVAGATYYRTQWDEQVGNEYGVISAQLSPAAAVSLDVPKFFHTTAPTSYTNPLTGENESNIDSGTDLYIQDKMLVNGTWYYRTLTDSTAGAWNFVDASKLSGGPTNVFTKTVNVTLPNPMCKTDLTSGQAADCYEAGKIITVGGSVNSGGTMYYMTAHDLAINNHYGLKLSDLFVPLEVPKTFRLKTALSKTNVLTLGKISGILAKDQPIAFDTKIMFNGVWQLRTAWDTAHGNWQTISHNDVY
jgi:hypothetical protein